MFRSAQCLRGSVSRSQSFCLAELHSPRRRSNRPQLLPNLRPPDPDRHQWVRQPLGRKQIRQRRAPLPFREVRQRRNANWIHRRKEGAAVVAVAAVVGPAVAGAKHDELCWPLFWGRHCLSSVFTHLRFLGRRRFGKASMIFCIPPKQNARRVPQTLAFSNGGLGGIPTRG